MQSFSYASPATKEEVVGLLSKSDHTVVMAGGTDLISLMKDYVESAKTVVSLRGGRIKP